MKLKNVEDVYPLSPLQEGMLFHTLSDPGSGVYLEQVAMDLSGPLSPAAMARAWQALVDRHPVLRTAFFWEGLAQPLQVVRQSVDLPWQERDWRDLPAAEQTSRWEAWLSQDRHRGFDLTRAPLLRTALFRTGERSWKLLWTFHHALLDGWSLPILVREMLLLHDAFARGEALTLPPAHPYRSYIAWLQRQDRTRAEAFWRRALAGFEAPTPLPIGRARSRELRPEDMGEDEVRFPAATSDALRALARRGQVTLSTVLQGAWGLLLGRYAGTADVVFGTVVSGRPAELADAEEIVGLFINTLPVRIRFAPRQPLLAWLRELLARRIEERQYEHTPLTDLQRWSEVPRGEPLFETLLVFENYQSGAAETAQVGELALREVRFLEQTNYPLVAESAPAGEIYVRLGYDRRLFQAAEIRRLLGHLGCLLEGMAASPERPVGELEMLTATERSQILEIWSGEGRGEGGQSVPALVLAQARRAPSAPAVGFGGRWLSYGELAERSLRLAGVLRGLGAGPETVVGVLLERSFEQVVAQLAVFLAGAAYLPLDPAHPAERLSSLLSAAGSPLLVADALGREVAPQGVRVVSAAAGEEAPPEVTMGVSAESLAYVIYTSGSTGRPKGVEVSHGALSHLVAWHVAAYGVSAADRGTCVAGLGFDASVWELWPYLASGASVDLVEEPLRTWPAGLVSWLSGNGATLSFLPTPLAEAVLGLPWPPQVRLRALLTGGDRLHQAPAAGVPFALYNHYGPTEAAVVSTAGRVEPGEAGTPSIGRPIAGSRAYVLDAELRPVPVGVAGELYVGGAGVARGYRFAADRTAEVFVPDPWGEPGGRLYRTGDRVRWREEGSLEFLGRTDQQVKIRGFRIEPGEVEAALTALPEVREAAVVPRTEDGAMKLAAYWVPEPGTSIATRDLLDRLRALLPAAMVPAVLVRLERLPLTLNGKVDRQALPAPEPAEARAGHVPPRTPLERTLARIWSEVLRVPQVGVDERFFDLGGDSLLAVRLMAQVKKQVGRDLPLSALLDEGTVERMAAALSRAESVLGSPLLPIRAEGPRPPLVLVHPGSGDVLCYHDLARHLGPHRSVYALQDPGLQGRWDFSIPLPEMAEHYVAALRELYPDGPYLLGGWSFGGLVAFEMASQFAAAGAEVPLLALLDAGAPSMIEKLAEVNDDAVLLGVIAREWGLDLSSDELRALSPAAQVALVFERLKGTGAASPDMDAAWLQRKLDLFKARIQVARSYRPPVYPGRITLFRSGQVDPEDLKDLPGLYAELAADATMGWSDLSRQPVEVHTVSGHHANLASEPHVGGLALQLRDCLERALAPTGRVQP